MKITAKAGKQILEVEIERTNGSYVVEVDGVRHEVDAHKLEADFYSILTGGRSYEVSVEADGEVYQVRHGAAQQRVTLSDPSRRARERARGGDGPEKIVSMMPGKVVRVLVEQGDTVSEGQGLMVIEAMKMENEIAATREGKIASIAVAPGDNIEGGAPLLVIE
jgi:biotin carboxyl carrier protein